MPHRRAARRVLNWWKSTPDAAWILINVIAAIGMAVLFVLIYITFNRLDTQNKQIAQATMEIQQQRRYFIYRTCRDQNKRNEATIETLNDIIAKSKIPANIKPSVLAQNEEIINAAIPKKNCIRSVRKLAPPIPTTTTNGESTNDGSSK